MTVVNTPTLLCEPRVATVALISNQYLVQLGIERVIEAVPHINLVGHTDSEVMAEALLTRTRPQLVLLDMESDFDSTALVHLIRRTAVDSKIVALCGLGSGYRGRDPILSQVDAIVLTVQPPVVLIAIIHSLCHTVEPQNRLSEVSPRKGATAEVPPVPFEANWPDILTVREREVVEAVAQGLPNKTIADRLCISTITVRHHLTAIFDKLGVNDRQNLLIHAYRCGFVALQRPETIRHSSSLNFQVYPSKGTNYPT